MRTFVKTLFLATALSTSAFTSEASAGTAGEVKVGDYLREAALHGFDGQTNKLSDYKGKPLIINVWASWCGPCRAEMGSLNRLAERYNGNEFNVIGISTDDDSAAASAFIKQSGMTFDTYLDRKLLLENMLGANTIPLTILVDANGRILKKVRGAYEWDSPKAKQAIEALFRLKAEPGPAKHGPVTNPEPDPMFGLHFLSQQ